MGKLYLSSITFRTSITPHGAATIEMENEPWYTIGSVPENASLVFIQFSSANPMNVMPWQIWIIALNLSNIPVLTSLSSSIPVTQKNIYQVNMLGTADQSTNSLCYLKSLTGGSRPKLEGHHVYPWIYDGNLMIAACEAGSTKLYKLITNYPSYIDVWFAP